MLLRVLAATHGPLNGCHKFMLRISYRSGPTRKLSWGQNLVNFSYGSQTTTTPRSQKPVALAVTLTNWSTGFILAPGKILVALGLIVHGVILTLKEWLGMDRVCTLESELRGRGSVSSLSPTGNAL